MIGRRRAEHRDSVETEALAEAQNAEAWTASPARAALVTTVGKAGIWLFVACGPIGLLAAVNGSASVGLQAAALPASSPVGPSGFAELYVAAYLRAGAGDSTVRGFFPDAPAFTAPAGQRVANRTVTTAAREVSPSYWSITVAAEVMAKGKKGGLYNTGTHYFSVPVQVLGDAAAGGILARASTASYVAAALPAEVAAPAGADTPELAYGKGLALSSGPLADTVRQFAAAYLTGAGELARYLSPGLALQPISPAPYLQAQLAKVTIAGDLPGQAGAVPADGTSLRVLADVMVTDAAGAQFPLSYALTVTARAGRWEVSALDGAPALRAAAPATTSSAPVATPTGSVPTGSVPTGPASAQPTSEGSGDPGWGRPSGLPTRPTGLPTRPSTVTPTRSTPAP